MVEPEVSTSRRGRPPPTIVTENFRRVGKVNNKSNRWYYECIHCSTSEGTGPHIESRDNNPIRHLTNPASCPNVPAVVRNAARTYLATKAQVGICTYEEYTQLILPPFAISPTAVVPLCRQISTKNNSAPYTTDKRCGEAHWIFGLVSELGGSYLQNYARGLQQMSTSARKWRPVGVPPHRSVKRNRSQPYKDPPNSIISSSKMRPSAFALLAFAAFASASPIPDTPQPSAITENGLVGGLKGAIVGRANGGVGAVKGAAASALSGQGAGVVSPAKAVAAVTGQAAGKAVGAAGPLEGGASGTVTGAGIGGAAGGN
ncbi:hypothetical protein J3A83DRAFT_4185487 [Scleroderma citrinum]